MRWIFLFLLNFLINESSLSQTKIVLPSNGDRLILEKLSPFYSPSKGEIEELMKGEVISIGKVTSKKEKQQEMFLFISGIHPRSCSRAMRKLSLYENYSNYMEFIKKSSYDEKTKRISLSIEHFLLPFPMVVSFKIDRITKEGIYPFTFEDGFLKDLNGKVILYDLDKHCLMSLKADWAGPETKIPNFVFATFLQTVGKLGLEHLIRVSIF